jgi:hypothetical protein
MNFNTTDAWILQSIFCAEKADGGASLVGIIGYADYVNHAILTYTEFSEALVKLSAAGLVEQVGENFQTTGIYKSWYAQKYAGKKNVSALKAMGDTEKYLNQHFQTLPAPPSNSPYPVDETNFKNATDRYLERNG